MTLNIRLTPEQTFEEFKKDGDVSVEVKILFCEPCVQFEYTYIDDKDKGFKGSMVRLNPEEWFELVRNVDRISKQVNALKGVME